QNTGFLPSEASWKSLSLAPIDPSRIGRYRSHLTARQIGTVERRLGRALRKYGYQPDPEAAHAPIMYLTEDLERLWWLLRRSASSLRRHGSDGSSAAREP
ncbi:MAG: hypothetical protein KDA21_09685, partial [Phycisphaerales bacterium]|nr:hypothetical protein [Phycisphaerales bacterium]